MTSETRCQHCGKTEYDHLLVSYFGGRQVKECPREIASTAFTPVVPPPAPFKVGDWVVSRGCDQRPFCIDEVRGEMFWYQRDGECVWDYAKHLRPAAPEEISAVTHFVPKAGMLIQRKDHSTECWRVVPCAHEGKVILVSVSAYQAAWFRDDDTFAHADWTILDSYTVQGVKP